MQAERRGSAPATLNEEEGVDGPSCPKGELRAARRLLSIKSRLKHHHHHAELNTVDAERAMPWMDSFCRYSLGGMTMMQDDDDRLPPKLVFQVVETLYRDHPGAVWRAASRKAFDGKINQENGAKHLVYGEISFIALESLLSKYVPSANFERKNRGLSDGITFYDLGCGAGRVVFSASLLHSNITKACGVEILPSMHHMNKDLLCLYKLEVLPKLHKVKQHQDIKFICGDFLEVDWSDADLIFSNATCFEDGLFEKIEVPYLCLKEISLVLYDHEVVDDNK
ncbi:hypothetical protein GOP47_0022839 [Adiantum capillus-veneris]|uniref:Histone-lysine N-methyltransferase, H3 lysine-79 specific n=1 Tax=Adiantum capillus-veneris TaxID=13818 RepID=A0A9D4U6L1_ADICA|nr:hypothetical protein GOP47_0022839 [Adiantum capillus-veneris]